MEDVKFADKETKHGEECKCPTCGNVCKMDLLRNPFPSFKNAACWVEDGVACVNCIKL